MFGENLETSIVVSCFSETSSDSQDYHWEQRRRYKCTGSDSRVGGRPVFPSLQCCQGLPIQVRLRSSVTAPNVMSSAPTPDVIDFVHVLPDKQHFFFFNLLRPAQSWMNQLSSFHVPASFFPSSTVPLQFPGVSLFSFSQVVPNSKRHVEDYFFPCGERGIS